METIREIEGIQECLDSGIDLQGALAMTGGDVALLQEMAGAFLEEVPRLFASLQSAMAQRDADSLRELAHRLQGVMRCLHIERALQQARQLELLGEGAVDWGAAERQLAMLTSTTESAVDALGQFMNRESA